MVVTSISAIGNTITVGMELRRAGLAHHPFEPAIWEWSSNLVILALVPALAWFTRRFPLHFDTWRRQLPWYLLASVAFSLLHVLGMVALRQAIYALGFFGFWVVTMVCSALSAISRGADNETA